MATRWCAQRPALAIGWDWQVLKGSQGDPSRGTGAMVVCCGQQQRLGMTVEQTCRSPQLQWCQWPGQVEGTTAGEKVACAKLGQLGVLALTLDLLCRSYASLRSP